MTTDVRWVQRFSNFLKAFSQLKAAVHLALQRPLSTLEEQGLIQSFEYTHELAWKTLKDFLENRGLQDLYGSKDTTRAAFKAGLIEKGDTWMEMILSRNLTTHTYDETTAANISSAILNDYYTAFEALLVKLEKLKKEATP
jgi:nucleotidyltransferase substrate binding protein (TIGR01987 family)